MDEEIKFLKEVENIDFLESAERKAKCFHYVIRKAQGMSDSRVDELWESDSIRGKIEEFAVCINRAFENIDNNELIKEIAENYVNY